MTDKLSIAEIQDEALILLATGKELTGPEMRKTLQSEVFPDRWLVESTFNKSMDALIEKGVVRKTKVRRRISAVDGTSHWGRLNAYTLIRT